MWIKINDPGIRVKRRTRRIEEEKRKRIRSTM
jgi:hypothetical protein